MRYSTEPRDRIFVKGYGFISFAKNIGKNFGKNISKNLSGKYSAATRTNKSFMHATIVAQKLFDSATKSGATKVAAENSFI